MHFFTGGAILLFAGVWAAPEGRGVQRTHTRTEESTLEQLRKLEENYGVVGLKGLEAKALEAVEANKASEERKRKQKAKALALKPEKCESVITSCAVVYESADCVSGWQLPIKEVLLIVCTQLLTMCMFLF